MYEEFCTFESIDSVVHLSGFNFNLNYCVAKAKAVILQIIQRNFGICILSVLYFTLDGAYHGLEPITSVNYLISGKLL